MTGHIPIPVGKQHIRLIGLSSLSFGPLLVELTTPMAIGILSAPARAWKPTKRMPSGTLVHFN